jgi:hypothetical protein
MWYLFCTNQRKAGTIGPLVADKYQIDSVSLHLTNKRRKKENDQFLPYVTYHGYECGSEAE